MFSISTSVATVILDLLFFVPPLIINVLFIVLPDHMRCKVFREKVGESWIKDFVMLGILFFGVTQGILFVLDLIFIIIESMSFSFYYKY